MIFAVFFCDLSVSQQKNSTKNIFHAGDGNVNEKEMQKELEQHKQALHFFCHRNGVLEKEKDCKRNERLFVVSLLVIRSEFIACANDNNYKKKILFCTWKRLVESVSHFLHPFCRLCCRKINHDIIIQLCLGDFNAAGCMQRQIYIH